jgi:5'-nucleotidase
VQVLAINDFHGALEPPAGANGRIGSVQAAGGMEYLATHLARLKATNRNTVVVSAGDNFGGTPAPLRLFHDEGSVEALNIAACRFRPSATTTWTRGGGSCTGWSRAAAHPVDGCQDGTPYDGAAFTYLSANITLDPSKADPARIASAGVTGTQPRPLFMPSVVKEFDGVRVGFIGLTVEDAPKIIAPLSTRGLAFSPRRRRRMPLRRRFDSRVWAPWSF